MNDNIAQKHAEALANLLFPNVETSIDQVFSCYPKRELPAGALVTRFGPSPTGFTHIGSIYTAMLNKKLAIQSGGKFILRIEDTDQNREIADGAEMIIEALQTAGLSPDEGPAADDVDQDVGAYGPYKQSNRQNIYHAFAKQLVADGFAYPCFLLPEELDKIRETQKEQKLRPGIYGQWAKYRTASLETIEQKINENHGYVLRLKSPESAVDNKFIFKDVVRGELELPENSQDIVLLKSDGYPTYHFAHPIDDVLMGVNLIIRGDEWISTTPIHVQLFDLLQLPRPDIAHIAPIAKMDGSSRRKLSKRKDDEASMSYYYQLGYEQTSIIEYLMNLLDSRFEEWRLANPDSAWTEFNVSVENLSKSSALFDWQKLNDIARDVMVKLTAKQRYQNAQAWANSYAPEFGSMLAKDPEYASRVLNIGVHQEQPRKDLAHWSEIEQVYSYFFDDYFDQQKVLESVAEMGLDKADKLLVLDCLYQHISKSTDDNHDAFIAAVREFAKDNGFALKPKDYKKNPEGYKGMWGEILMMLRVLLTGEQKTPDLHDIIPILGLKRCQQRINSAIDYFR